MNHTENLFLILLGLLILLVSLAAVLEGGHRDHKLQKTGLILVGALSIQLGRRGPTTKKW